MDTAACATSSPPHLLTSCPAPLAQVVTRGGRGSGGGAAGGGAAGSGAGGAPKQAAQELLASMEGLSARERNRLKRKAKALGRSDSLRGSEPPAPGPGGRNKVRRVCVRYGGGCRYQPKLKPNHCNGDGGGRPGERGGGLEGVE